MIQWLYGKSISSWASALLWLLVFCLIQAVTVNSRAPLPDDYQNGKLRAMALATDSDVPVLAVHAQGNLQINVGNWGEFGAKQGSLGFKPAVDPLTGTEVLGCTFPANSNLIYLLRGDLLIGGIVGEDTLVDLYEFRPDGKDATPFEYSSSDPNLSIFSKSARAKLELTCEFYDTLTRVAHGDVLDPRGHIPLGVKVTQRSMAWTGPALGNFVIIDYEVEMVADQHIEEMYFGIEYDNWVQHESRFTPYTVPPYYGPLTGHLSQFPVPGGCGYVDRFNLAYAMDNDGDPIEGQFDYRSPRGAVGVQLLTQETDSIHINYNWAGHYRAGTDWIPWRPRRQASDGETFRPYTSPYSELGDRELYHELSHHEIDYDQVTAAVNKFDQGWLPPPQGTDQIASGAGATSYISWGPTKLGPGQKTSFTIAVVAGDNVHHDPTAYEQLFDPYNPEPFYDQLDFSELAHSARWAKFVYDNPGVDTDGDGYFGKYRLCDGDTIWLEGDGVPDLRADSPPLSPLTRVITSPGKLIIRWNGYYSETSRDALTREYDFEGYRVYYGLDERENSLTLLSAFDRENYTRHVYTQLPNGIWEWQVLNAPFTLDSLRSIYDDPQFEPLLYTRVDPLVFNDTRFYFTAHGYNQADLSDPLAMHKVYPEAINPGTDTTLWTDDDLTDEHGEPLPKFYEYEYVLDNLLPTIPYYVTVTAIDYGSAAAGVAPKESDKLDAIIPSLAMISVDSVLAQNLDVYVYPNPYRIDGGYAEHGYEWRIREQEHDRNRKLHFANLPPLCTISIYSLDGDLIRKIDHNFAPDDPAAMHDTWDFITRSGMAPVSGLYYWTVEAPTRTQIGKFVIIK